MAQTVKNPPEMWDISSLPDLGRSPGEGHGNPLQYSCLENPLDRGAWQATVHGVAKSRTRLSDFTSLPLADCSSLSGLIPQRTTLNILVASLGIDVSISTYDFLNLLFIYLTSPGLFCGMWTLSCSRWDLSPWTEDWTQAPCIGNVEF